MTPYWEHPSVTLHRGDCRQVLRELPAESVQCVVTSPPYWSLRDYGLGPDALGLEPTPDLFVAHMVEVCVQNVTTTGWRPTCAHEAPSVPCVVLDPFVGSGTTAMVARDLGRKAIGIDASATYLDMAIRRVGGLQVLPL